MEEDQELDRDLVEARKLLFNVVNPLLLQQMQAVKVLQDTLFVMDSSYDEDTASLTLVDGFKNLKSIAEAQKLTRAEHLALHEALVLLAEDRLTIDEIDEVF